MEISIDMPDQNYSASSFDNNICHLRNEMTGARLHGLLLTESVVRFPNHRYQDLEDKIMMMRKGREYCLQSIARYESNDCHYAIVVNPAGVLARVPGVKSLLTHLLPVSELDKISYVGVHDPEGQTTVEMPYKYYVRLPQVYCDGQTRVEGMAGLCTYGDIPVRFLRPGAFGGIITTKIGSAEKIVGQFTGITPMYRAYVFPAVTVEEWNRVVATLDTSMSSMVPEIKAKYMLPKSSRKSTPVYTLTKCMDMLGKRSDADHTFTGGITTIASLPGNCLPIDHQCGKQPVMTLQISELYGVQKYPVMNKQDIERKCSDKIPPDDSGVKNAENSKLVKARQNVTTEEHPCTEPNLANTFSQKACELAEYWKLHVDMRYEPMSLEDAIWGNNSVQVMDLDTSTGAAFQMLFPGKTKKNHIIGEHGEFKGEAGIWLKSALKEQWEHWKKGELWILPGSYSLKAECLPIEKVWKKRLVNVCDPVTTINSRHFWMQWLVLLRLSLVQDTFYPI